MIIGRVYSRRPRCSSREGLPEKESDRVGSRRFPAQGWRPFECNSGRLFLPLRLLPLRRERPRSADLPTVEAADQYVRICDAFGAGFFYIPGTDSLPEAQRLCPCGGALSSTAIRTFFAPMEAKAIRNSTTGRAACAPTQEFDAENDPPAFGLIRTYVDISERLLDLDDYEKDYSDGSRWSYSTAFVELSNDHWQFYRRPDRQPFFDFFGSDDFGTRIDIDDNTTEQTLVRLYARTARAA